MNVYEPGNVRNILLVGHSGAGKTTLTEGLVFAAGAVTRMGKVEDGNTVSDHDAEEIRRGISVSLSLAPVEWNGVKINVLDAPGYADFIGDVRGGLRAADACLFVVSAVDGVEVQTEVVWELAAEAGLPRAIFVNKIDRERASFDRTLDGLVAATEQPKSRLCTACFSGEYPIELPEDALIGKHLLESLDSVNGAATPVSPAGYGAEDAVRRP